MRAYFCPRQWLLAVLMMAALPAVSGTLWLNNGDKISGDLVRAMDGKVVWKSPVLGELSIPQSKVSAIETASGYSVAKASGDTLKNCVFVRADEQQKMRCDGQEQAIKSWQTVLQVANGELHDKTRYNMGGSVAVALSDSGGNTEEEEIAVDANFFVRNDKNRHNFNIELDIQENDGQQTQDEQKYTYQYDRFVSEKWFLSGRLGLEKDDFQFLEEERRVGVGVGYQFLDNDAMRLSFGLGVDFIEEDFADGTDNEREAIRASTDYNWKILPTGLSFFHRNSLALSTESSNDWEFDSESGLIFPVVGRLSSELKFEFDYDNQPAEGDSSADRVWTVGVRYDW